MTDNTNAALAYLDANIFIFFFQGSPSVSERVRHLLEALRNHPGRGVTSELTLAEVLAEPDRPHTPAMKRAYLDLIVWSDFIELVPVSRDVLYESAELRSIHRSARGKKLDLPDAIHLTTAIQKRCRYFVSGDDGIKPPNEMTKLSPLAGTLSEVIEALSL